MLYLENLKHQQVLSEFSDQEAANINGANGAQPTPTATQGFNQDKYLQALGVAYLKPPGVSTITEDEALLAQFLAWQKSSI